MHSASLTRTQRQSYHPTTMMEAASSLMWDLMVLFESVLALRFLFKIAGANPDAMLTDVIYRFSTPFVKPFAESLAPTPVPKALTPAVFEWSTVLAMVAYPLMTWTLIEVVRLWRARPARPRRHHRHMVGQVRGYSR